MPLDELRNTKDRKTPDERARIEAEWIRKNYTNTINSGDPVDGDDMKSNKKGG